MSSWTLDVDTNNKTPNTEADACAAESSSRWQRHGIYRVPAFIKELNPRAYRPQVVSLGPFHHGNAELLPMEEHKQRALRHLLRRSGRPLEELRAAVHDVAEQLAVTAYRDDLGDRERLVDMLIVDGCFLLEAMRVAAAGVEGSNKDDGGGGGDGDNYDNSDPVFSRHGVVYMMPFVRRDMLMLEKQLPLLVLQRLLAVVTAHPPSNGEMNRMALKFLSSSSSSRLPPASAAVGNDELGLHPLAVYRGSLVHGGVHRNNNPRDDDDYPYQQDQEAAAPAIIRPAVELHEAGVRFKKSRSNSLRDIRFQSRRGGVLSVPAMSVDDSTEYMFLNMMAFEKLHAGNGGGGSGSGDDVAAYVFFMSNLLGSASDVALLCSEGIIENAAAGSDKTVAQMFERMSRDAVLEPETAVDAVQRQVSSYCRRRRRRRTWIRRMMCGVVGTVGHTTATWTWSVVVAVVLVMLIMQTVYTAVQLYMLRRR